MSEIPSSHIEKDPYYNRISAVVDLLAALEEPLSYPRIIDMLGRIRVNAVKTIVENLRSRDSESIQEESSESTESLPIALGDEVRPMRFTEERELLNAVFLARDPETGKPEAELARKAKEELLKAYMPVIRNMAVKIASHSSLVEDLIQEGCVIFLEAIDRTETNGRFLTRLLPRLFTKLSRADKRLAKVIVVPSYVDDWEDIANRRTEKFAETRDQAIEYIAETTHLQERGVTAEGIQLAIRNKALSEVVIVPPLEIAEFGAESLRVDQNLEAAEVAKILREEINLLDPKYREVLNQRAGENTPSFAELAPKFGVTRQAVKYMETRAKKEVRGSIARKYPDLSLEMSKTRKSSR